MFVYFLSVCLSYRNLLNDAVSKKKKFLLLIIPDRAAMQFIAPTSSRLLLRLCCGRYNNAAAVARLRLKYLSLSLIISKSGATMRFLFNSYLFQLVLILDSALLHPLTHYL